MYKVDYRNWWKKCLSWVCVRRRQNGVHQTSVSAVPNAQNEKCVFNLNKIRLDATVKNNGTFKAAIFKICCISRAPLPYFTYGDLHSGALKIHAFQLAMPKCKTCCYSGCFKMCLKPMEFEYFCITRPQPWQHEARCDRQNFKLKCAYHFDGRMYRASARPE